MLCSFIKHGIPYQVNCTLIITLNRQHLLCLGVSKKPAARFRPVGPPLGPARRPALRPAFNFFLKNNILYFYIYITNSFNKYKRNVAQLVRALKFMLEGRVRILLSSFLYLKAILAYLKKPAARPAQPAPQPASPLARGLIGRAAGLAF